MKSGDEESGVELSLGINKINPLRRSFTSFRMTVRINAKGYWSWLHTSRAVTASTLAHCSISLMST